jgi:hypothetical protein
LIFYPIIGAHFTRPIVSFLSGWRSVVKQNENTKKKARNTTNKLFVSDLTFSS